MLVYVVVDSPGLMSEKNRRDCNARLLPANLAAIVRHCNRVRMMVLPFLGDLHTSGCFPTLILGCNAVAVISIICGDYDALRACTGSIRLGRCNAL